MAKGAATVVGAARRDRILRCELVLDAQQNGFDLDRVYKEIDERLSA